MRFCLLVHVPFNSNNNYKLCEMNVVCGKTECSQAESGLAKFGLITAADLRTRTQTAESGSQSGPGLQNNSLVLWKERKKKAREPETRLGMHTDDQTINN